jgi:hypothetical protein
MRVVFDPVSFSWAHPAKLGRLGPAFAFDHRPGVVEPTLGRALRWFIDTLALGGCGMAGVYVGELLDPSNVAAQPPPHRGSREAAL